MRPESRNQLEMLGKPVAAEVPARFDGNRRWISVWKSPARHPLDPTPPARGAFHIRQFELPVTMLTDDYSPYDGDLVEVVDEWVDSFDEVEEVVSRIVDPAQMRAPWRCAFPL